MLRIFTNNVGSQGLQALRTVLDPHIRTINRHFGETNLKPTLASENGGARVFSNRNRFILNWGTSAELSTHEDNPTLNRPVAVGLATNKRTFFEHINDYNATTEHPDQMVRIPNYALNREDALNILQNDGIIYARTRLTGHSGEGIVVARDEDELPNAQLYTSAITGPRREYRIHVFGGRVVLCQLKKRRSVGGNAVSDSGEAGANDQIRNLDGGWVYSVSDAHPSELVRRQAINAVTALGLDFGAVDIIAKGRKTNEDRAWVLEVNTAPGQGGDTTVTGYARNILTAYVAWHLSKADPDDNAPDDWRNWDAVTAFRMLTSHGISEANAATLFGPVADDAMPEAAPVAPAQPFIHDEEQVATQGELEAMGFDEEPPAPANSMFERMQQRNNAQVSRNGAPVQRSTRIQPTPFPAAPAAPVAMPTASTGVSRLGRNDPQNEQFVVFTYQDRTEVGIVNTLRGVVYMAGSDLPLPIAEVTLTHTVNLA